MNLRDLTDEELIAKVTPPNMSEVAASELRRRLSSLRAERDEAREWVNRVMKWEPRATAGYEALDAAVADRDRLTEALEWYAEQRNYLPPAGVEPYDALMARDAFDEIGRPGARARAVLAIVSEARR